MQADPVPVRIGNPSHPAHAGFDRFDKNFDAPFATKADGPPNIVSRQRDTCRAAPVPLGMALMPSTVETERQRFGGELAPEIVPLVAALEAKKFLIKGTGSPDVLGVVHHEIERPNRN